MQFTITINGEKAELPEALKALRNIMDGQASASGEVSATYEAPQPTTAAPSVPTSTQPAFPQQAAAPTAPAAPLVAPPPVQQPMSPAAVPTATQTYTQEQLGVAAGPIVDAGRSAELTSWLNQRGYQALTQLPKEQYGEFAIYLRSLGAKI